METGALTDPVLHAGGDEALVVGGEADEVGLSGHEAVLEGVEGSVHLDQAQHQPVPGHRKHSQVRGENNNSLTST